MKHLNIRVIGIVQGVFFRKNTKIQADKHQIKGWVRNEPDGSVYIEAEGEEANLETFGSWLHVGPERSQVEKVVINKGSLVYFEDFIIKY